MDAIASTAQTMMEHIDALGSDITQENFNTLRMGFSNNISETFDDVSEELGPKGTELVNSLLAAINAPVDVTKPGAIEN